MFSFSSGNVRSLAGWKLGFSDFIKEHEQHSVCIVNDSTFGLKSKRSNWMF